MSEKVAPRLYDLMKSAGIDMSKYERHEHGAFQVSVSVKSGVRLSGIPKTKTPASAPDKSDL